VVVRNSGVVIDAVSVWLLHSGMCSLEESDEGLGGYADSQAVLGEIGIVLVIKDHCPYSGTISSVKVVENADTRRILLRKRD
ncbi:hypothetical protein PENTCL1PPCAC_29517, partial [Pristionchus entomophagus]